MAQEPENGQGAKFTAQAMQMVLPLSIVAVFLLIWQVMVQTLKIPEAILPTPLKIIDTIILRYEILFQHTWPTTRECLIGFVLSVGVGVGLGILLALSRLFRTGVYPLIIAFQVVPKVALAPLFIVWFGLGTTSRILLAFVIAFFPMVVITLAGIQSTDPLMIRMAIRIIRGSVLWMPARVITTMGKKAITKASRIREVVPRPNQTMKSGARATLGTTWKAMMSG